MSLKPRQPVPALDVPLVGGGRFRLAERKPKHFTMLAVYRGLHCPICKGYLSEIETRRAGFLELGVEPVALSTDSEARALKAKQDWGLETLPIAYGLPVEEARRWGLYISSAIRDGEPAQFAEPGLFLIRPDRTLYCASIQTMPFTRPNLGELLGALHFITTKDYPARGEV